MRRLEQATGLGLRERDPFERKKQDWGIVLESSEVLQCSVLVTLTIRKRDSFFSSPSITMFPLKNLRVGFEVEG